MNTNLKLDEINFEENYGLETILEPSEFLLKMNCFKNGLTSEFAKGLLQKDGPNELRQARPKRWYHYFFESLFSPFNIILLLISLVLIYTDIILSTEANYANIIVILVLVSASTILEFTQEYRSNKAAAKLRSLVAATSTVLRDEKKIQLPMKELVKGDVVILSAGDMIPADLRIIEEKDLHVGQSTLTGESEAVRKLSNSKLKSTQDIKTVSDLDTICFMGTNVISGSAKGVVIKTANDTYLGKIAKNLETGKPKTAFQKGIENISKLLIRFMLVMIPITFLVNVWKHDILLAFTFSVAIAIGITPLLLPVILSSSLAKGAIRMSKKKTIVKKMDSIQSFGAMNILCTDKTGTLTKDEIVLQKYLDIHGNENYGVLKHAYLNAYFQTGLKGNIDTAIIDKANEMNLSGIPKKYTKIDEIPFDFSRRRLSVVVSDGEKRQLITKGAVEEILSICTFVYENGNISEITPEIKDNIRNFTKKLNSDGLRVIAVCQKNDISDITNFSIKDETKMVLMGFIGFLDPPKETAKEAIERLNKKGIRVIVLTGDNLEVTRCICNQVGIHSSRIVSGNQVSRLSDIALLRLLYDTNIFVKLSPIEKARIVRLLKEAGSVVGYMGDGINDSPSLTNADVGISVDTAVDIAKETSDIILLEKDLNILLDGAIEGRKTFANLLKYIKMAVSFNFGEVLSVLIASVFLPFLPITPIQLLVQSLLYDFGQLSLPFDNVDSEYVTKPRKWNLKDLRNFMFFMGPTSSIFDLMVFASLWFGFGLRTSDSALFQTIWFSYGVVSNLIGLHIIRTAKTPFVKSNASLPVYATSITLSIIALIVPFTILGSWIGLVPFAPIYLVVIIGFPILYCFIASVVKKLYIRKYGEWI
ncbi:MAG: magnesium-translocating P-type ATPase [Clostridia bacterium]|nr:magnesium-translocating P-type ATPase [Clostridia bacterium]